MRKRHTEAYILTNFKSRAAFEFSLLSRKLKIIELKSCIINGSICLCTYFFDRKPQIKDQTSGRTVHNMSTCLRCLSYNTHVFRAIGNIINKYLGFSLQITE